MGQAPLQEAPTALFRQRCLTPCLRNKTLTAPAIMTRILAVFLFIAFLAASPFTLFGKGEDGRDDAKAWWPQFLGPQRNGLAPDAGLNTDWNKTRPKVLWKVPLGDGFSSFAIVGARAYTMCQRANRSLVVCLDTASGKELWTKDVAQGYVDKQKQGIGPRSTPTYHEGKL